MVALHEKPKREKKATTKKEGGKKKQEKPKEKQHRTRKLKLPSCELSTSNLQDMLNASKTESQPHRKAKTKCVYRKDVHNSILAPNAFYDVCLRIYEVN